MCVCYRIFAVRDGLFQKRKAVAQAAFGGSRENGDCPGFDLKFFFARDALDFFRDLFERKRAKLEKLRARFNRIR